MLGYDGYYATGVAWYLSTLFAVSFAIYPLLCKYRGIFVKYIAPFSAICILGIICKNDGTLNGADFWWGGAYQGLLHAYASMAIGCVAHEYSVSLNQKKEGEYRDCLKYGVIEVGGYAITLAYAAFHSHGNYMDFYIIPCLFFSISISFSEKSIFNRNVTNRITRYLGAFSLSLYLNHFYIKENLTRLFPTLSGFAAFGVYLAIVVVCAAINYIVGTWLSAKPKPKKYLLVIAGFFLLVAITAVI